MWGGYFLLQRNSPVRLFVTRTDVMQVLALTSSCMPHSSSMVTQASIGKAISLPLSAKCSSNGFPQHGFSTQLSVKHAQAHGYKKSVRKTGVADAVSKYRSSIFSQGAGSYCCKREICLEPILTVLQADANIAQRDGEIRHLRTYKDTICLLHLLLYTSGLSLTFVWIS